MPGKDRNFDELAERFERRVYGGLKGRIRLAVLWRDLLVQLQTLERRKPVMDVLDAGGGLGQIAVAIAGRGHRILYNDLSPVMLQKAQHAAQEAGVAGHFEWQAGAYQLLPETGRRFDLVVCHALLEWLSEPEKLLPGLRKLLREDGLLSLCYYNPAGKVYRNLVRGNFDMLNQHEPYRSDTGSLTPNAACSRQQVLQWLDAASFDVIGETGIRVFSDYVVEKRGGHGDEASVLDMELRYSELEPYKWLGRYQHIVAAPRRNTV